jgi:hypothetical protein
MLTSLLFHVLMTTMHHKNEKLQQSFDFLGIRQVLVAAGVCMADCPMSV